MTGVLLWLAVAYAAFKFAGMILARGPGFRPAEISLRDRLRWGEPTLFLAAFLVAVPPSLLASWGFHRADSAIFRNAVGCYARVTVLGRRPEIRARVDGMTLYESVEGYRGAAYVIAPQLGMTREAVARSLETEARSVAARLAALGRRGMRPAMAAELTGTLRCLSPKREASNA